MSSTGTVAGPAGNVPTSTPSAVSVNVSVIAVPSRHGAGVPADRADRLRRAQVEGDEGVVAVALAGPLGGEVAVDGAGGAVAGAVLGADLRDRGGRGQVRARGGCVGRPEAHHAADVERAVRGRALESVEVGRAGRQGREQRVMLGVGAARHVHVRGDRPERRVRAEHHGARGGDRGADRERGGGAAGVQLHARLPGGDRREVRDGDRGRRQPATRRRPGTGRAAGMAGPATGTSSRVASRRGSRARMPPA